MIITDLTSISDALRLAEEACRQMPDDVLQELRQKLPEAKIAWNDYMYLRLGSDEWIVRPDEDALVGLVMKLTGGSAIPAVVRAQIENARQRLAK